MAPSIMSERNESSTGHPKMDHSVSDVGSPRATSQEIVQITAPRPSSSFLNIRRIFIAFSVATILAPAIYLRSFYQPFQAPLDPTDYAARTKKVLSEIPLIDGHNDLPYLIRVELKNRIYNGFDFSKKLLGHTDLQRMRKGQVGGQFWSAYVECPGVRNAELYKQENLDQPTVR